MKIVSDGPKRFRDATKGLLAKREAEIRAELTALSESEFSKAGLLRRWWISFRIRAELRRRLEREFPRADCLHLTPQK